VVCRGGWQRDKAISALGPWLPEAAAISQAKQSALRVKTRLLQRFFNVPPSYTVRLCPLAVGLAFGAHQLG
jgi:hypothetical protein